MCGRFAQCTPAKKLAKDFQAEEMPEIEPRYNVAPAQDILGICQTDEGREAALLKWGLAPS
jgi:putative SOS response-associated peptidase YedK